MTLHGYFLVSTPFHKLCIYLYTGLVIQLGKIAVNQNFIETRDEYEDDDENEPRMS